MERLQSEQVRGRPGSGSRSLALPVHRCRIIVRFVNGMFRNVHKLCQNIVLGHGADKLKIRVCYTAVGICKRDKMVADPSWEGLAPQNRLNGPVRVRHKVNTAHAGSGSVTGANGRRGAVGDELCNSRQAGGKVGREVSEIVKETMKGLREAKTAGGKRPPGGSKKGPVTPEL